MRPKIVIIVLLAGAAGLCGIFFLKNLAVRPQPETVPVGQPVISAPVTSQVVAQFSPASNSTTTLAPATTPPVRTNNLPPVKASEVVTTAPPIIASAISTNIYDEAAVQEKINRLEELQTQDDAASLKEILGGLTNSNQTIRHAAIEATTQFGGHTAVPVLRDLAAHTSDPDEKKELLDAADFLELPTLTEIRAQNPNVKIIRPMNPPPAISQP